MVAIGLVHHFQYLYKEVYCSIWHQVDSLKPTVCVRSIHSQLNHTHALSSGY